MKLSVCVQTALNDPKDLAELKRIIGQQADVFIQNLRPGVVDKLGLGAAEMLEAHPDLIYCNVGAYGDKGSWAGISGLPVAASADGKGRSG